MGLIDVREKVQIVSTISAVLVVPGLGTSPVVIGLLAFHAPTTFRPLDTVLARRHRALLPERKRCAGDGAL
jgi:hypothetical protein